MKTALIMMSILGCDDTGSQCHYVKTQQQRWTSIELCDAASERELSRISDVDYPMLVAVCQTPIDIASRPPREDDRPALEGDDPLTEEPDRQGLATRALARIKGVLPNVDDLKDLAGRPVRLVTDSYSWVARKVAD
ncbi:hypothetical protein MRS76_19100 [Rhizobiaceae bacterium n13]|uniref:Uncharacterized protein n=1 Tax=Ferirhizobium litorale TaxID=2927786 RepID=A0AAE3QIF3_9HYPH|nr:hypothetical protein [Fererhizobium litorale]MDI7864059.1 hypothetical protein [Fererhizobium litorale]MDI7924458.1 hypothetical protein [Fererhizobium litorale]